jgi:hypothetical protein
MSKKVITRIIIALAIYGIFVALVMNFYDDNPSNMKWEDREDYNRHFISKVQLNKFNFEKALEELGSPDLTEAKRIKDDNYQVMFYRTHHVKSDGITTQEECTALLFKNNLLMAIGKTAYEQFKQLD